MESDLQSYLIISGILYVTACILVTAEADSRGYKNNFAVFMFCLFCTPLIGAIMYSHFKQNVENPLIEEVEETVNELEE